MCYSRRLTFISILSLFFVLSCVNQKISIYVKMLPVLENDTRNIIEYVEQNNFKKKKFNFWNLLESDD